MADPSANYVFLPWVRQGAAAGIQTADTNAPDQSGVVSVTVKLRVNDSPELQQQVQLYGPGDVIGIDPQQVVRTEPANNATDFEPNYFPAIEFDRPDFPWLFTPAKADAQGRLRPWLCLIVVRKDAVTMRVEPNRPLPVLEIAEPDLELPDLSESWAWAHTQIAGTAPSPTSLTQALAGNPALTVSRLLCPRRLDPLTQYLACVVPAFELGRRAGLGDPIHPPDEQPPLGLAPAWSVGAEPAAPVRLPIYFHWEFRTGTGGDFESLVGLLKAREIPEHVGKRPMDITDPGFRIDEDATPGDERIILGLEGALRTVEAKPDEWPNKTREPFQKVLRQILNAAWDIATKENDNQDPIVGPPIYGCWQAARHRVELTATPPATLNWLDDLNLDPRHRATAAIGTQVVQTQQEQLMASAWEQLGEIERINQMRRQAQFGRAVNNAYHARHFSKLSTETLLKILAPAQSRIVVEATRAGETRMLLSQTISQSRVPSLAVSAPLRRLSSPRGVISSRFVTVDAAPIAIMAKLNTVTPIVAFVKPPSGAVTLNQISDAQTGQFGTPLKQTVVFQRVTQAIDTAPRLNFTIVPEGFVPKRSLMNFQPAATDSRDADMFRKLVKAQQDHLMKAFMSIKTAPAPQPDLFAADSSAKLLRSVDPEKTIYARVQASQVLPAAAEPAGDKLEPILDAPQFPQPMYEALRDLSQDYMFPGLEHVPPNTVALLETNPEFVESFLVGLNAEMSSELLWRNYPTDQRGTYFRQFWDTSVGKAESDIGPINEWDGRRLGENAPRTSGKLVLLVRGELLRRYPSSVIYAVRAIKKGTKLDLSTEAKDESHPLFRGTLKPDVTFLGFNLTDGEALGQAPNPPEGWFFVIQQQPTEPRFGLDVANFATTPQPPLARWNDLNWGHFANNENELKTLTHASAKKVLPAVEGKTWGKNSAHQAFITLQRPVRIAIHARQMIKPGS